MFFSQVTSVVASIRFLTCIETVLGCCKCRCQTLFDKGNDFVYLNPKEPKKPSYLNVGRFLLLFFFFFYPIAKAGEVWPNNWIKWSCWLCLGGLLGCLQYFSSHLVPQTYFFKKRRIQGGCHCRLHSFSSSVCFCIDLFGKVNGWVKLSALTINGPGQTKGYNFIIPQMRLERFALS